MTEKRTGERTAIPVEATFRKWRKNPDYVRAYDALEDEFALLNAIAAARAKSKQSQAAIARKMKTSQAAVARLEAGRGNPSLKTLQRYAAATGTRLSLKFEAK